MGRGERGRAAVLFDADTASAAVAAAPIVAADTAAGAADVPVPVVRRCRWTLSRTGGWGWTTGRSRPSSSR